jgi:hypothetical protein
MLKGCIFRIPLSLPKNKTMFLRTCVLFAFVLGAHTIVNAQLDEDPRKIFRELRDLEGSWFMPTDRGDRIEEWSLENDSTLVGTRFRIRDTDGDTIILEAVRIELRDTSILFSSVARNQNNNQPVVYRLTNADYEGYLFETTQIENPQTINYRLFGNREIQINTEGKKAGRTVTEELVYEREFSKSSMEFRMRAGANVFNIAKTGSFQADDAKPEFGWRPGWELGTGVAFKGQGGYFALNIDVSLMGKNADVTSAFTAIEDTTFTPYVRNGNYRSTWIQAAFLPEFFPVREGRFSILAGPYIGRLVSLKAKGTIMPEENSELFETNNDLNKTDFGVIGGLQYRFSFGEKDFGSLVGIRANVGLKNLDNLYDRGCDNPAFCNGQLFFRGVSLYYSMNLLKL